MEERAVNVRRLISDLAVVFVCAWTGYFLRHGWRTMNELQLGLLVGALLAYCGGGVWALSGSRTRLAGVVLVAAAAGAAAVEWCVRRPSAGALWTGAAAVILPLVAPSRLGESHGPLTRFLFGVVFASAALAAGFAGSLPAEPVQVVCAAGVVGYVGLVGFVWGGRPVAKGAFALVVTGTAAALLVAAGLVLGSEEGLIAAVMLLWVSIRVGGYGWQALQHYGAGALGSFAEHALEGAGLVGGAMLALNLPGGAQGRGELAWPVVLFGFSSVQIWVGRHFVRRLASGGAGGA